MRCLFVYNPVSGRGRISKKLDTIVRALEGKYEIVDVRQTKQAGDMTRIAYGVEGIKKNLKFDIFEVDIAERDRRERTESVFVMLMNGKYVAGMRLNKQSSMRDGKIEVAIIRQRKNPNFFNKIRVYIALAHLFLRGYRVREKQIIRMEGSHFEISTGENVVWNFDGEKGVAGKVVVDVLPKKINMLVPKGNKKL